MQTMGRSETGMSGPMPGTFRVEDARDLMITGLKNAHGLEQQAIEFLRQEKEMANWLEEHLPGIVNEHLMLMQTGEQKR
jgi:hypothetical protein